MDQFAIQGYSASNMLMCVVDGAEIYRSDYMGNRKLVGKTLEAYQELEETTKQYYDKLVELGVIVPPKSQEELMGEMQRTMADMTGIIAALSEEVKELKKNGSKQCTCGCGEDVPKRESKRGGTKGTGTDHPNPEQP